MNTTVYLIRHGEVVYPRSKSRGKLVYGPTAHLSTYGEKQIHDLAETFGLTGVKLDALYTSPLNRAVETAQIFSNQYHIPPIIVKDLRDVESPAADQGMMMDELKALKGDTYSLPGHESQAHLTERITRSFGEILEDNQGRTIAIFGHGDPIRVLIYRLKNPEGKMPSMKKLAKSDYLDKSQAWRLVFDQESRLIESEVVTAEGSIKPPERKF